MEKFETNIKFYDSQTIDHEFLQIPYLHEKIILPSFYRCGNTLTRELIEGITGIVTGSDDNHNNLKYNALGEKEVPSAFLNFKGSNIIDNSVWIYKTHFPSRKGIGNYKFEKIICLLRNPFDALDSMFNLYTTNTHTDSITKDMYKKYDQEWNQFISDQIESYKGFYSYWIRIACENEVPIIFCKYEDLITNTKQEICKVVSFMLNSKQLSDEFILNRINSYLENRKLLYIPRKGINYHSLDNFTTIGLIKVFNCLSCLLIFCEYEEEIITYINKRLNLIKECLEIDDKYESSLEIINKAQFDNLYNDFTEIKNSLIEVKLDYFISYLTNCYDDKLKINFYNNLKTNKKLYQVLQNTLESIKFKHFNDYSFNNFNFNETYKEIDINVPNLLETKLKTVIIDTVNLDIDYCNIFSTKENLKRLLNEVKENIEKETKIDMNELRKKCIDEFKEKPNIDKIKVEVSELKNQNNEELFEIKTDKKEIEEEKLKMEILNLLSKKNIT